MGDLASVGVHDRIERVLPTHVFVALRTARAVLLETICVEVTMIVHPGQALLGSIEVFAQQRLIAGPEPRLVQHDRVEDRGVGSPVVRRVRHLVQIRQLAHA